MKDVIILGCGPTHAECKYHCDTWGVNGTYGFAPKLDKLFFTDEVSEVEATWYDLPQIKKVTKTLVFPVIYPKFANVGVPIELYPMDEIRARFPTTFYSNSIAYMIAYALYFNYERIYFYGIDMMTSSTYIQEKGGVEFWMGIALGLGVKIVNTRGSATGKTWNGKMYGHWGGLQEERLKERLYAPHELVRTSKSSEPGTEWIKVGEEYKKIKTQVKAGEEIAIMP